MRVWRLGAAAVAMLVAVVLGLLAHDLLAWDDGLARGDREYASSPRTARWSADTWLPGDPAGSLLDVEAAVARKRDPALAPAQHVVQADDQLGLDVAPGERHARGAAVASRPPAARTAEQRLEKVAEVAGLVPLDVGPLPA